MLKEFIPPVLLKYITGFFYGWNGNYSTWDEAQKKCSGYDSDIIFTKVKESLLKVKKGEAVFERDSVLFDKIHYSFPLLSGLSIVALKNNGKLNVLDFGGSLGSSYYQNKNIFKDINEFNWSIVEQPHFVKEGLNTFADKNLHFFYDVKSCMEKYQIDVLLLASVLQYLEEPYLFLDEILSKNIEYIIIDRTPILIKGEDRITIQTVPKNIYNAKYPCRIINEQKLVNYISNTYDLIFDFESPERINLNNAALKAYFFKRKITSIN
jgi:putative methyltransferase (TIGR04325 family)